MYRGSTFAADALALGLKPFYLKLSNEIEIDSLWMFKDSFKEKIINIDQFNIKLLKLKNKKNSISLQKKLLILVKCFMENLIIVLKYKIILF